MNRTAEIRKTVSIRLRVLYPYFVVLRVACYVCVGMSEVWIWLALHTYYIFA